MAQHSFATILLSVGILTQAHASESLILRLQNLGHTERRVDAVLPAHAFAMLDQAEKGTENPARKFLKQTLEGVRSLAPSGQMVSLIRSSFPEQLFPLKRDLLIRFGQGDPEALDQLADDLLRALRRRPEFLNRFPIVPIEMLPAIQRTLFDRSKPGARLPAKPYPLEHQEEFSQLVLKTNDCPVFNVESAATSNDELVEQSYPMKESVAPCFFQNSKALAPFLNTLTNALDGRLEGPKLSIKKDSKQYSVSSAQEFFAALKSFDLTVELFNARVFVDFSGTHIYDPALKTWRAIRMATFVNAPLSGKRVNVPAEHGEVTLMIRQGNTRLAQVNWFFGIPDKRFKGTATYWRPNIYLRPQWQAYSVENLEVLKGEKLKQGADWLLASAYVMKGFQAVQQNYDLPFNSYGIFVCVDSAAFFLEKLSEIRSPVGVERFATAAFPVVYGRKVMGTDIDLGLIFAQGAEFDTKALFDNVVSDVTLARALPSAFALRLNSTFKPRDDKRLLNFNDFSSVDLKLIRSLQ